MSAHQSAYSRNVFLFLMFILFACLAQANNMVEQQFNEQNVVLSPSSKKRTLVVVEFGFSQPSAYSTVVEQSKSCRLFSSKPEDSEYSWHGDKVLSILKSTGADFDLIPIKWGLQENENKYFEIFDCIDELSKTFNIVGVNFSTAWINQFRDGLSKVQLKKYDSINEKLTLKLNRFLNMHPEITVTVAAGNDSFRVEDVIAFPHTVACSHPHPINLVCITAYSTESKIHSIGHKDPKHFVNIANNYYYFNDQPDGTIRKPLPLLGRFSGTGNFIALPAKEINTSFLSPWYLLRHLTNPPEIFDGYGVSVDLGTRAFKKFQIHYINENPNL